MPLLSINLIPRVHADVPYSLNAVPAFALEGTAVNLVLSVTGASHSTQYQFRFSVTNPAGTITQSLTQNFTTGPAQDTFSIVVPYPGPALQGKNTLVGMYSSQVDQLLPTAMPAVARTSFFLSVTDSASYQRTQTVSVQAGGYNTSESVTVNIKTQTTSTLAFSSKLTASSSGIVGTSWKIPWNATIDNYVVTLTGTSTTKNPADVQQISVGRAIMIVSSIGILQPSYRRNDTMRLFFQPKYPDGSVPSTGAGLLTLARPDGTTITLTATYDFIFQTFDAAYQTSVNDEAGTWTVSLTGHAYSDSAGNSGPGILVTNSIPLTILPLTVTVTLTNTTAAVGQQLKFNANITYPNGVELQSGSVKAYLIYSGTPVVNDTVPMIFDSGLKLWLGSYTVRSSDTGGLWSLVVKASDSAPTPANSGTATRAITIQNASGGNPSLPLYFFGIIASLLALLLFAVFLLFRRRKVSHARLKIDLDAVRSEAGRIESTDFFQSVKDQVRKEQDDK